MTIDDIKNEGFALFEKVKTNPAFLIVLVLASIVISFIFYQLRFNPLKKLGLVKTSFRSSGRRIRSRFRRKK